MAIHNDFGHQGEDKAVEYLENLGYVILERNWRIKRRELDIICSDGERIIVVEVKSRTIPEEHPEELLDRRKKHHLLAAAAAYLKLKGIQKEVRFDLILVTGLDYDVLHIPDAVQIFD